MNTKIKQTIALFFTVMLLFVLVLPPLSAAADASPIKVGYYEDGDYMSKSQSGEYSGYNIEYLQKFPNNQDFLSKWLILQAGMLHMICWLKVKSICCRQFIIQNSGQRKFSFPANQCAVFILPLKRSYE